MNCDYCGKKAILVTGKEIYPHRTDLFSKKFWNCSPCKAFVGCHGKTNMPLGRLANALLRKAKMNAHEGFDPIWKDKLKTRSEAYSWLAKELQIKSEKCHIGMFDVIMCQRVVRVCENFKEGLENE